MDATEMKFAPKHFDVVFDKGTLDAILCGGDSARSAGRMLWNVHKVMKPGSKFFVITYGAPQSRENYLKNRRFQWDVKHCQLGTRHLYTLTKK